ncbi:tRNA pseudouridine(55) synthase TruB [Sulfurospirillum arcachonense]|uniref:tRNA pseudouridine(55) synthase TruB n=1 Tax=Sulfurospirillum arcachonense TaxID=57666 RepID=UPI0004B284B9|nr:tRNA pseudouridine(55) synthase TruB [Sulfurospirillum arcachonense]
MRENFNRLFVAYKPTNMSSNRFLGQIKRKYNVKKAGFSGTLDPFAKGALIIAFGQYTKLFRFLKKKKKAYRATLWIGATSPTLDIEKVEKVEEVMPFAPDSIKIIADSMKGEIEYLPPKYCAKKVDGKRAYALAREDKEFELNAIKSTIHDFKILHYMHPFLTFEITISEGGYIRSMGSIIASKLGFDGALSSLERLNEGEFVYDNEKALNPIDYIDIEDNEYLGDIEDIELGRKVFIDNFKIKQEGLYKIVHGDELSVLEIVDGNERVEYILNKVKLC